jgi:hypothetical protein
MQYPVAVVAGLAPHDVAVAVSENDLVAETVPPSECVALDGLRRTRCHGANRQQDEDGA